MTNRGYPKSNERSRVPETQSTQSLELIDYLEKYRPKVTWQIGRSGGIQRIMKLKDDASTHIFSMTTPMSLLGIPVNLVEGSGLRLSVMVNGVETCPVSLI